MAGQKDTGDSTPAGRYARQVQLPSWGAVSQKRIGAATAIVVGVGALGSVEAELLVRAGVGTLRLIDPDILELNNLQRQALYVTADIGREKVHAAVERLLAINPAVALEPKAEKLTKDNVAELLDGADVIVDGTDNMATRFLINEYAVSRNPGGRVPVVFASAVQDKGTVFVSGASRGRVCQDAPCYACLYKGRASTETAATSGIWGATTHMVGSVAASEALKILAGAGTDDASSAVQLLDGLFSFALLTNRFDTFAVSRRENCDVCGKKK